MLQTAPKWLALTAISVPPQAECTAQRLPCCPQRLCPKPVRERMSRVRKHSAAGNTNVGDLSRTKFIPVHRKHQRLTPFQPLLNSPSGWLSTTQKCFASMMTSQDRDPRDALNTGLKDGISSLEQLQGAEKLPLLPLPITRPHLSAGTVYVISWTPPGVPTLQSLRPRPLPLATVRPPRISLSW